MLAVFSVVGSASTIIPGDPDIAMDAGSNSPPIGVGFQFAPGPGGGGGEGMFDFFNPFSATITSVSFQVDIKGGLTQALINSSFACQSGYFLGCGFTYQDFTTFGLLTIKFSGVKPSDNDPNDAEVGEQEGIPSLRPGCTPATADSEGCNIVGHFFITLNDHFATSGDSGGWSDTTNPSLFNVPPNFIVADIETPEPGTGVLLGTALLMCAIVVRRRTRA